MGRAGTGSSITRNTKLRLRDLSSDTFSGLESSIGEVGLAMCPRGRATFQSKVNSSATDSRSRLAIRSNVSNEGALTPRSTRLRKSTDTSSVSANCSCVIRRCARIVRRRCPNFLRSEATSKRFPRRESAVVWLRPPPNETTGRYARLKCEPV
jgi:hypothetical protein